MGIIVIIVIMIGILAGAMSYLLDGVPSINPTGFVIAVIGVLFLMLISAIIRASNQNTNHNDTTGTGDGGIEYTIYPDYPPSSNHPMLPSGGDDEIIDAEVTEVRQLSWHEQKRLAVERRQLETTKEYEKRLLGAGKKVKR